MNETSLNINDMILPVRIVSTVQFILGAGSNCLVIFLSSRTKEDRSAFVLLLHLAAASHALTAFFGWMVLMRIAVTPSLEAVFLPMGLGDYLGVTACHFMDSCAILIDTYIPTLICLMMAIRTAILFNFKVNRVIMLTCFFCVFLSALPEFIFNYLNLYPLSVVDFSFDPELERDIHQHSSFVLIMSNEAAIAWELYDNLSISAFAICVVLRIVMQWKLSVFAANISDSTKKVHSGFINLLTLEAIAVFLYFLASKYNIFYYIIASSQVFAYPEFIIPTIVQGIGLLYFVPYLRKSFKALFGKKETSAPISIISTH